MISKAISSFYGLWPRWFDKYLGGAYEILYLKLRNVDKC